MSFPSGHACAAFAGFGFLALYLNAKFGVLGHKPRVPVKEDSEPGDRVQVSVEEVKGVHHARVSHWKLVLFVAPILVAVVIAASKVRDMWHHPIDVVFGGLVGTLFALMAYRMVFESVWDQKTNHLAREVVEEPVAPDVRADTLGHKGYLV